MPFQIPTLFLLASPHIGVFVDPAAEGDLYCHPSINSRLLADVPLRGRTVNNLSIISRSEGQGELAEKAASLGAELFVVDDGWFDRRNDGHRGLGDWWVNREKFPNGLGPLIEKVRSLGMSFGLWVEPEMVNLDSRLYREHPDGYTISRTARGRRAATSSS